MGDRTVTRVAHKKELKLTANTKSSCQSLFYYRKRHQKEKSLKTSVSLMEKIH